MARLPSDLLLEIVIRTDFLTIVRCAAVSKQLRCDILSPPFISCVIQEAAPCILASLCTDDKKPLTLVHPATSPAAFFCHDYLSSFMLRNAGTDVLDKYYPVASRGGLVLLEMKMELESKGCFDMCVYEPMTGRRMFLSEPPDTMWDLFNVHDFVLLTEADGIGCSFMLLSIVFNRSGININTATSSSCTWGAMTCARNHDNTCWSISWQKDPAVLHGGIIHWLTRASDLINIYDVLTYDVRTNALGRVKLPLTNSNPRKLQLATSQDGNLLKLLAIDEFMISVWLQLPTAPTGGGGGGGWVREAVIDIEEKLRPWYPVITVEDDPDVLVQFIRSGKRSSNVVLLQVLYGQGFVVLDMETEVMHFHKGSPSSSLLEIDLPSHVQTMKVFS